MSHALAGKNSLESDRHGQSMIFSTRHIAQQRNHQDCTRTPGRQLLEGLTCETNHLRGRRSSVIVRTAFSCLLTMILCPGFVYGEDRPVDYGRDIKPILQARCYACHGALKQESGLRLDTGLLIRKGSENGQVVSTDQPQHSTLIERISSKDDFDRMPPEGEPLSAEQIAMIQSWIASGAKSPEDEQPEADPDSHWAFLKPVRSRQFSDQERAAGLNPIDVYLAAAHKTQGLEPVSLASQEVQLRRLYLDLIGIPPTRDELRKFLDDTSEDAFEKVVDQLLDDPRYGERWGRHWMDVWRYSDWYGRRHVPDVWNSAPQIWRWRDWIVRSLNEDKGYDQMVSEMLAADEIRSGEQKQTVATGYLIRNWFALNPNDWMRNTVEHTGKAFLGLTFNCAHCHDHKYDPISQDDYFRFRAFFEPIGIRQDRVPDEADPGPFQEYDYSALRKVERLGAVTIFDKNPEAPTWFYTGGDERNRDESRGSIAPGVPGFLDENQQLSITPVDLPVQGWSPGQDPEIQRTLVESAQKKIDEAAAAVSNLPTAEPSLAEHVKLRLAKAEEAYREAKEALNEPAQQTALVGNQSLVFNATQGRRTVFHRVSSLSEFSDGFEIDFQIRIVDDSHFNFQLAKHVTQGLTAAYVAFEKGRILSYRPGSFSEIEAGRYDFENGQDRFRVSLRLQTEADLALLTIESLTDQALLVADLPIALNGWNPIGDPTKGVFFDARPGSLALVDELTFRNPAPNTESQIVAQFNFEAPEYRDGQEIVGQHGWEISPISGTNSTSIATSVLNHSALDKFQQELEAAQLASQVPELQRQAAEGQLAAARAELASLQARIAAEAAKFGNAPADEIQKQASNASQLEQLATIQRAESQVQQARFALATAEAKPESDGNRTKEVEAARAQLATSMTARSQAESQQADSKPGSYTPLGPLYPKTSTGRRSALAAWIVDRENPLTARVAVNHIWMRHFHQPLVETVDNFGRSGAEPTHPELLDWLAVELMESNWSMKHLHRLIVTSDAFRRQSSTSNMTQNVKLDPENDYLWRMNTGRMESEVVRDSLLHVAGKLDFTQGGQELENKDAYTTFRRSIYYSTHPENGGKSTQGELFDAPDGQECYRRTRSIVPQQALALTNSETIHSMSSLVVQSWEEKHPDQLDSSEEHINQFTQEIFEQILSRSPSAAELKLCNAAFHNYVKLTKPTEEKQVNTLARESLVRAIFNHGDFITIR